MAEAPLLFERDGPLALVTFNRPEARNAITWEMYDGLLAARNELLEALAPMRRDLARR